MTHIEGPIVDSFYDMSLCSWHNELKPPLPSHNSPAALGGLPTFEQQSRNLPSASDAAPSSQSAGQQSSNLADGSQIGHETTQNGQARDLATVAQDGYKQQLPENTGKDPHFDKDIALEITRAQSVLSPRDGESRMNAVTRHMSAYLKAFMYHAYIRQIPQYNPIRRATHLNVPRATR